MDVQLTAGAVARLVGSDTSIRPTLQCIDIKQIHSPQGTGAERFRLVLSDGQYSTTTMLATQMNMLIKNDNVKLNTVIQLSEFLCNNVQGRKIVIVLNLNVVADLGHRIGNPVQFKDPADPGVPPAAAAAGTGAQNIHPNVGSGQPGGYKPEPAGGPQYGSNPGSNYGAPPNQGGYGGGGGGYGAPPAQGGGYGAPPAQGGGYGPGGGAPSGFGNNYGAPPGHGATAGGGINYGNNQAGNSRMGGAGGYAPNARFQDNRAGPTVRDASAPRILPIKSLNPYQSRWTVKARVTVKSEMRHYHNARGDGKLFNFDMLDATGGEIRAVAFNDTADKFFDIVEPGHVYTVSKGSLKPKRAQFNHTNSDYEITLEPGSLIERCAPDDPDAQAIASIRYAFSKISQMEETPAGNTVDILGVVDSVGPETSITRRDGQEARKRSIIIKDDTQRSIELTLWGQYCTNPGDRLEMEVGRHPILAVKGARVGDFNGKNLSTVNSSVVNVDPDIPEAGALRHWYDNGGGAAMAVTALSGAGIGGRTDRVVTLAQIKDEELGVGAPAYVSVQATVTYIRSENMAYPACSNDSTTNPERKCAKKLMDNGDDTWFCEKCGRASIVDWRYILSVTANDHTGNSWLTLFNESGTELLNGCTAAQLKEMETNGDPAFEATVQAACFKNLNFRLRIQEDTYNDETRIKTTVRSIEPVDYVKASKDTLDLIRKLQSNQPIYTPQATPAKPAAMGYAAAAGGSTTPGRGYAAGGGYAAAGGGYSGGGGGYSDGGGFGGGNAAGGGGGGGNCYKCGGSGHWARDCPQQGGGGAGGGGGGGGGYANGGGFGGGARLLSHLHVWGGSAWGASAQGRRISPHAIIVLAAQVAA